MATASLSWIGQPLCAAGLGLLIGLEREHARLKEAGPEAAARSKGARTFALISLLGYGTAVGGERYGALPVVAFLGLAIVLSALHLARRKRREAPPEDVTTEVAALCAAVLGLLVRVDLNSAVALGLLVTAVLLAKPWSRSLVPKLRREELTGTLQLLVALLIVLPVVPDRPLTLIESLDWVLNPRSLVLFIVLTAGIGYVGYFMVRVLGAQRGLPLTGLVGGLTSSTAVTLAMGEHARATPALLAAAALSSLLACAVMVVRVVVVTAVVYWPLGRALALPAVAMCLGYLASCALLFRRQSAKGDGPGVQLSLENPFELGQALKFGALYAAVILGSRFLRSYLGARGFYLASALAGIMDVDSITLAAARLCKDGAETLTVGATAIWIGIVSNSLVKGAMALSAGGRGYGLRVLIGQMIALCSGAAVLLWQWLR